MTKKRSWTPNTKKHYDPNDPRFDPMHPPDDTPPEVLADFWAEPIVTSEELPDGRKKITLHRPEGDN